MTVIAYKDGVMACDSCWSDNGLVVNSANKIVKLSAGGLLGEAGDSDTRDIIRLLDKVKKADQLPEREAISKLGIDYAAILALPDGTLWNVYADIEKKDYGLFPIRLPFAAVGCGRQIAIGAMAAGASAVQAASIACQWDTHCRLPIHQAKLQRAQKQPARRAR